MGGSCGQLGQPSGWVRSGVMTNSLLWFKSPCLRGKSTISMVMFNSYVELLEGRVSNPESSALQEEYLLSPAKKLLQGI